MRIHYTRDEYGLLLDKDYIPMNGGCAYHKNVRNGLEQELTRFERTINASDVDFSNNRDMLIKIIKGYKRHMIPS